jgi:hypothetical protein
LGSDNPVVMLSSFFLLFHLSVTLFMRYYSLRNQEDTFVTRGSLASSAAFATAFVAVLSYLVAGLAPIVKAPFFLLKYIPGNQYWLDHLIIGIPTFLTYMLTRYIAVNLLEEPKASDNLGSGETYETS